MDELYSAATCTPACQRVQDRYMNVNCMCPSFHPFILHHHVATMHHEEIEMSKNKLSEL